MDAKNTVLTEYDAGGSKNFETKIFKLNENQQLIGIYGVKEKLSYITSFGFLIRERFDA